MEKVIKVKTIEEISELVKAYIYLKANKSC